MAIELNPGRQPAAKLPSIPWMSSQAWSQQIKPEARIESYSRGRVRAGAGAISGGGGQAWVK